MIEDLAELRGHDGPQPAVQRDVRRDHRPCGARRPLATILDAPGARGTVRVGTQSFAVESGERLLELPPAEETIVEAVVASPRAGTWRFEAQDAGTIEPGSLRVIAGDALSVGSCGRRVPDRPRRAGRLRLPDPPATLTRRPPRPAL